MRPINEIAKNPKVNVVEMNKGYIVAGMHLNGKKAKPILCIGQCQGGWDHVSVSYKNRTPTWDEMCAVKDIFFEDEECVVQYHPPKSEYVNVHDHCLHLWRKHGEEYSKLPITKY